MRARPTPALFAAAMLAPHDDADIAAALAAFRARQTADVRPTTIRATDASARRACGNAMTTVGILGGGQLARMLALSGAPLGLRFLVMDATADACAGQFAPMVVGDYRDEAALAEFASRIDVATFDFENVPAESAQWLSERVPVFPSPARAGDRAGPTGGKDPVPSSSASRCRRSPRSHRARNSTRRSRRIGTPAILKTRRLGYDGKGQFRLRRPTMPMRRGMRWARRRATVGLILEGFVAVRARVVAWSPCAAATANSAPGR